MPKWPTSLLNTLCCDSLLHPPWNRLAFPTGRDSETFQDNGTEVPSLSRDKGTTGQAKNFAKGRDRSAQPKAGTGRDSQKPGRDTGQSRKGRSKTEKGCSKTEKDVLKQERMF